MRHRLNRNRKQRQRLRAESGDRHRTLIGRRRSQQDSSWLSIPRGSFLDGAMSLKGPT